MAIIGGGIGGLAAAVWLAAGGARVTLCEAHPRWGGKMRSLSPPGGKGGGPEGLSVEAGPTVVTMAWVFEALFAAGGADFHAACAPERLAILARHAWPDGGRLDLHDSRAATRAAIGNFAGAAAVAGYDRFARQAQTIHRTLASTFIDASRPGPLTLAGRIGAARIDALLALAPWRSLWSALAGHFPDPRLAQLYARYATYVGASPFSAPATLMLIADVEQDGVWRLAGGMPALAAAVAELAARGGVTLRANSAVRAIGMQAGRAASLTLVNGERIEADAILHAGDSAALTDGLLGEAVRHALPRRGRPPSLSAHLWVMNRPAIGFDLAMHNVVFAQDYRAEFAHLAANTLPPDPTIYLYAPDRGQGEAPCHGPQRLMALINAPPLGPAGGTPRTPMLADIRAKLAGVGLDLQAAEADAAHLGPAAFARDYPGSRGSLYGPATRGAFGSFSRPGSRTRIPGLYLAGGTVHPGAGVPMAALSGRRAAEAILQDWRDR